MVYTMWIHLMPITCVLKNGKKKKDALNKLPSNLPKDKVTQAG